MTRKLIDLVYIQSKSTMLSAHNQDQEWTNTARQHNNTMTLYKEVPVISKFWALAVILIVLEQLILGIKLQTNKQHLL
mgnify:CR=1 FL=1